MDSQKNKIIRENHESRKNDLDLELHKDIDRILIKKWMEIADTQTD